MRSIEAAEDVLVDPGWIADHLSDPAVQLVEVDVSAAAYDAGHIPGAVLWNAYGDLRRPDYTPVGPSEFQNLLSRSGVTPETTIVFYGYAAHLGFWLMKRYGHRSLRLMDGSRDRWSLAGHSWSSEHPAPRPSVYSLPDEAARVAASLAQLLTTSGECHEMILDVRSQAEFDGERFWPSGATAGAGRAGHIPGAVNLPFESLRGEDGAFRSTEELRELFDQRGVSPERGVVTYCTIGNRAAQAWFVLSYLLGYPDVRVYYGSWAEWGTQAETPVAT